jgi:hypothetical protein
MTLRRSECPGKCLETTSKMWLCHGHSLHTFRVCWCFHCCGKMKYDVTNLYKKTFKNLQLKCSSAKASIQTRDLHKWSRIVSSMVIYAVHLEPFRFLALRLVHYFKTQTSKTTCRVCRCLCCLITTGCTNTCTCTYTYTCTFDRTDWAAVPGRSKWCSLPNRSTQERETVSEMSCLLNYRRTSNNGHCQGIQILSVIGGVR